MILLLIIALPYMSNLILLPRLQAMRGWIDS